MRPSSSTMMARVLRRVRTSSSISDHASPSLTPPPPPPLKGRGEGSRNEGMGRTPIPSFRVDRRMRRRHPSWDASRLRASLRSWGDGGGKSRKAVPPWQAASTPAWTHESAHLFVFGWAGAVQWEHRHSPIQPRICEGVTASVSRRVNHCVTSPLSAKSCSEQSPAPVVGEDVRPVQRITEELDALARLLLCEEFELLQVEQQLAWIRALDRAA